MQKHNPILFQRYAGNPILSAADWPYPVHSVFNPGATRLQDGTILLFCRVEDRRGISHLSAARSANGIDNWTIDPQPTFAPQAEEWPEEIWGVEDPRITYLPELERYAVVYTAYSKGGPCVSLALTSDFVNFERYGVLMQPENKDAALLPFRINGSWQLVHRPVEQHAAHIWISSSQDLHQWGGHKRILTARRGAWWDANKIGLSPPLIHTSEGWLMIYHGVRMTPSGCLYRLGLALFASEAPETCLLRGDSWMFGPEAPYERFGDVGNVVFPCGVVPDQDGDGLLIYYGCADSSIAVATASIKQLLAWLYLNGNKPSLHDEQG